MATEGIDPLRFRRLALHGGVVCDDFVDFAGALREELLDFPRWKMVRLGGGYDAFQTGITTGRIQGRYPELDGCHRLEEILRAGAMTLAGLVGAAPEAPPAIDIAAFAYGEGGRLKPHTDSVLGRHVAWMLYLVPPDDGEWGVEEGGHLVFSDRPERPDLVAREEVLLPRFNRFAAFRVSDASWHEIRPVRRATPWGRSRLALSGWLYT